MDETLRCGGCEYWGASKMLNEPGECRRYPPTATTHLIPQKVQGPGGIEMTQMMPITATAFPGRKREDIACGEYRPKTAKLN